MEIQNELLLHLPSDVRDRLKPSLKLVTMQNRQVVHSPGEELEYLYFPLTCMISITVTVDSGTSVETGAVGNREVAGINALMGECETTQTEYMVQVPGQAMKIAAAALKAEFDTNEEMRSVMLKYMQAMIAQISQNTACNRAHGINQRCARWLLEASDRLQAMNLELTHKFISEMLGTTRSTVSRAAARLKEKGIIDYGRSTIFIIDLHSLKDQACECYEVLQNEYDRLLGPRPM